jgi:hypothetical protein
MRFILIIRMTVSLLSEIHISTCNQSREIDTTKWYKDPKKYCGSNREPNSRNDKSPTPRNGKVETENTSNCF